MTGNRMRDVLLASIALALLLAIVGLSNPPLPTLVGATAALGLGMACGLWVAAFAVLSHGLVHVEVVTLRNQRRTHGLIAVIA